MVNQHLLLLSFVVLVMLISTLMLAMVLIEVIVHLQQELEVVLVITSNGMMSLVLV